MKIEIKNQNFRRIMMALENCNKFDDIKDIYYKELQPQYEKAFLKYQKEKQTFKIGQKVKFRSSSWFWNIFNKKVENDDWIDGSIYKVSRLSSGKYKYIIKYLEPLRDYHYEVDQIDKNTGNGINYTNPITEKNIRKI